MVKSRTGTMAANVSDTCPPDRPQLVDKADIWSEIYVYHSLVAEIGVTFSVFMSFEFVNN